MTPAAHTCSLPYIYGTGGFPLLFLQRAFPTYDPLPRYFICLSLSPILVENAKAAVPDAVPWPFENPQTGRNRGGVSYQPRDRLHSPNTSAPNSGCVLCIRREILWKPHFPTVSYLFFFFYEYELTRVE